MDGWMDGWIPLICHLDNEAKTSGSIICHVLSIKA